MYYDLEFFVCCIVSIILFIAGGVFLINVIKKDNTLCYNAYIKETGNKNNLTREEFLAFYSNNKTFIIVNENKNIK